MPLNELVNSYEHGNINPFALNEMKTNLTGHGGSKFK